MLGDYAWDGTNESAGEEMDPAEGRAATRSLDWIRKGRGSSLPVQMPGGEVVIRETVNPEYILLGR